MTRTTRLTTLSAVALLGALAIVPAPPAAARAGTAAADSTAQSDGCRRTLPAYPILVPAARRPAVRTLQCALNDVGVGPVVVDGYYGPQTRAAVRRITDGFEGPGTHSGRINNGFWTLLYGRQLASRVLRLGDHGRAVTILQRALRAAGADIVVDGDFGPQTRTVLLAYQRDNGVAATGKYNEPTAFYLMGGAVFGALD